MGRRGEKKVATWKYEKDKASLEMSVYLIELANDAYNSRQDGARTYFRVDVTELGISVDDTDINELKKKVWKELDTKLSIQWTDWLYVQVNGYVGNIIKKPEPDDDPITDLQDLIGKDAKCDITLEYERLQLGQIGEQKMQRDFNNYHNGHTYYAQACEGWPSVGKPVQDEYKWSHRSKDYFEMRALVPDTPENRTALDAISEGFGSLLKKLTDLLSPEKVNATLAEVKSIKFLGSGMERPKLIKREDNEVVRKET